MRTWRTLVLIGTLALACPLHAAAQPAPATGAPARDGHDPRSLRVPLPGVADTGRRTPCHLGLASSSSGTRAP